MIGSGIPINQRRAPFPKPMATSAICLLKYAEVAHMVPIGNKKSRCHRREQTVSVNYMDG